MADITLNFYSHALERTVNLRALVPVDGSDIPLDSPAVPLPALYLLHGLYGSERDWFQYTRVALWARQKHLAVFCPAGENSFYVKKASTGEDYMRFIGEELPAFARRLFPLSHRREDTFIGGLSMGGYGALNAAFLYPQTFGKAAVMSSALRFWERMNEVRGDFVRSPSFADALFGNNAASWDTEKLAQQCGKSAPEIFLACGASDDLLSVNQAMDRTLTEIGISHAFSVTPGAHTWDYWDETIHTALNWLLP